jgi:hypothetical protein
MDQLIAEKEERVDLRRWAEDRAPTIDTAGWRDAERDAAAGAEWEVFDPQQARALLHHLHTVAIDVLTADQARVLAECCDAPRPDGLSRDTVIALVELLAMRLIDGKTLAATDYGYEVNRHREEHG